MKLVMLLSFYNFMKKYQPDIIITDIQMPKLNGLEFVKELDKKIKKLKL